MQIHFRTMIYTVSAFEFMKKIVNILLIWAKKKIKNGRDDLWLFCSFLTTPPCHKRPPGRTRFRSRSERAQRAVAAAARVPAPRPRPASPPGPGAAPAEPPPPSATPSPLAAPSSPAERGARVVGVTPFPARIGIPAARKCCAWWNLYF